LQDKAFVKLDVVDVFGNTVANLINAEQAAGPNVATWNGTDAQGNAVSAGTYIYRLTVGNQTLVGKMTLAK